MYNILFVCYGNICRSPMADMIFKDLVYKNNKKYLFNSTSRATSMEELGNDIYPKAKEKLIEKNITVEKHISRKIKIDDYNKFDYIIVMEEINKRDLLSLFKDDPDNKIHLLLEYTDNVGDIDDPWYTDDFETAYNDIYRGCVSLFNYLKDREKEE